MNVQAAGEQVFVDLLPEAWTGLPPPLQPAIVAELARHAREAAAALKARLPPPAPKPLTLELARGKNRTRLSLKLPAAKRAAVERAGPATRLTIPRALRVDDRAAHGRLDAALGRIAINGDLSATRVTATPTVEAEQDDDTVSINFIPKLGLRPSADARPPSLRTPRPRRPRGQRRFQQRRAM